MTTQDYGERVVLTGDAAEGVIHDGAARLKLDLGGLDVAAIDTAADYIVFLDADDGVHKVALASALGGGGGGGGSDVKVNSGSVLATVDLQVATPASGAGDLNVIWQESGGSVSAYVDVSALEPLLSLANITTGVVAAGQLPAATTSVAGAVELATSAEATAGLAVQASDTRLMPNLSSQQLLGSQAGGTPAAVGLNGLQISGGLLGVTGLDGAELLDGSVTTAKIADTTTTDVILGRSTAGAGPIEEIACTSFGRALIDDASVAAQRTTLGLGTAAVEDVSAFDAAGDATAAVSAHASAGSPHSGITTNAADIAAIEALLPTTVYRSVNESEVNTTASQTDMINTSVLEGAMGANDYLRVLIVGNYRNHTGGNVVYTPRVKWGGTELWGDAAGMSDTTGRVRPLRIEFEIRNLNSTSLQSLHGRAGFGLGSGGSSSGEGNFGANSPECLFTTADGVSPTEATAGASTDIDVTMQMNTSSANAGWTIDLAEVVLVRG